MHVLVRVVVVASLVCGVFCDVVPDIYSGCGDSVLCAEKNLVGFVDQVDSKESVGLLGDFLTIEKTHEVEKPRGEDGLVERIARYLSCHEIKVKLNPEGEGRALMEEARKGGKLKKIILPLLLLLKFKAAIVLPAVLFGIALIAFNGMGAGFMALIISGALAFKNLLEKSSSSTFAYEVVPQISSPHWSRTGVDAVAGYVPGYQTLPQ